MQPDDTSTDPLIQERKENAKKQPRGNHGQFASKGTSSDVQVQPSVPPIVGSSLTEDDKEAPPVFQFKVTNPVKYLKLWWHRVMSREGVDFKFRIHPVTALLIATVLVAGGAGFGWVSKTILTKVPIIQDYIPTPSPVPATPNPNRDAAYSGVLRKSSDGKFYLQTGDGQAVNLIIPTNVSLEKYVGKRIFATGVYNTQTQYLTVSEATDLEVLPQQIVNIPTITPSPTPLPTVTPTSSPIAQTTPEPTSNPVY